MADTTTREALAALMMKHGFATGHGDTHADLIAEFDWQLAELRAAHRWQPIKTAPRDNRARLVWCPERQNIYIVTWWSGHVLTPGWAHFGGVSGDLMETPTHWMPLPAAPEGM